MTTLNAELAYLVLDHIDAHPEQWKQGTWWCGTGGCFAGWTCTLSGERPTKPTDDPWWMPFAGGMPVDERAAQLLGFDDKSDMDWRTDGPDGIGLFYGHNTREDLGRLVAEIFGPRPGGAA